MGNALSAGDGLTIAELSAIESYSIGMTSQSRTTEDDNTASVVTRQQLTTATDERTNSGRMVMRETSEDKFSVRQSRSANNRNQHHHHHPQRSSRPKTRYETDDDDDFEEERDHTDHDRREREYSTGVTDDSRTDNSSAYHHGYRLDDDEIETRDELEHRDYRHERGHSTTRRQDYRGSTDVSDMDSNRRDPYRSNHHHHHHHNTHTKRNSQGKSKGGRGRDSFSVERDDAKRILSRTDRDEYDTTGNTTTDRETTGTVADILPAETDMAYAGSEDEDGAINVVATFQYGKNENDDTEEQEPSTASSVLDSLARLEDQQRQIQEQLYQNTQSYQSDSFSTLTRTVTTFQPIDPVLFKKEFESYHAKMQQEALASQKSPVVEEVNPAQKKLEELLKQQQLQEERLQKQLEELRIQKEKLEQLQEEKKRGGFTRSSQDNNENRHQRIEEPREDEFRKSPPATTQEPREYTQSPKTNNSLESARNFPLSPSEIEEKKYIIERLESARQKVMPCSPNVRSQDKQDDNIVTKKSHSSKSSMKSDKQGLTGSLKSNNKEERDQSTRASKKGDTYRPTASLQSNKEERDHSTKASKKSDKLRDTVKSNKEERNHSTKASKKSDKSRPSQSLKSNKEKAEQTVSKIVAGEDFQSLEDKYTGDDDLSSSAGSATGEMEGSVPEFEDVPSQFKMNSGVPAPYPENDLTTLSASLSEDELDDDNSDVSSIKEHPLEDVMSSMDEEIDLDFVAKYDRAFNAFLDKYPALFDRNSDLIQNLKVAKLQRILEVSYQTECDLEAQLENPEQVKSNLEAEFQQKLKEASRQKAARSIQLQSDLNHVKKQSKTMEGKLTWDMLLMAIKRANKLKKIKSELKDRDLSTREDLIAAIPSTEVDIIRSINASPRDSFGSKQKHELQQYQVDNAFLNSEARVLRGKIASLKEEAKKHAWVDAVLVRLDSKKLHKLKSRYQKKLGVSI